MISQRRLGLLFVLVGPPGVGKNALMNTVLSRLPDLQQLPTATTRPIRPTEQQGREHLFVNRDEFQQMIEENALIESQIVHGEFYGMPKATVEEAINHHQDLIADIDVLGATYLSSIYPDNAVLIFIQPPSVEVLKRRMQARGETESEIEKRMRRVNMEMQYAPLCDYLIINDNIDQASETLYAIVLAERSHRSLLNLRANNNLPRHRFIFAASVIPVFEDEILCKDTDPSLPTARLAHGELPHEAALRVLQQEFNLIAAPEFFYTANHHSPNTEEELFILPASMEYIAQSNSQQITFFYIYRLPDRLTTLQNWHYAFYGTQLLPERLKNALREISGNYPDQTVESYHEPARPS